MSAAEVPDREARRAAATVFDRNLVVLAGAGTGKTSLLVERLLVAIGLDLAGVSDFAAITFTEKAAAEMRERLADGLEELRNLARGADPDVGSASGRAFAYLSGERGVDRRDLERRALAALVDLDRARVVTIHAFCSELLRSHPVEAGVDPEFEVDRGPIFAALRDEAWEEFLGSELGPRSARGDLWRRVLAATDLGAVREIAFGLSEFGIPASLLDSSGPAGNAAAALRAETNRRIALLDSLLARQVGMTKGAVGKLGCYRLALALFESGGASALREAIRNDEDLRESLRRSPPEPNAKLRNVEPEEMESVAKETHRLARALLSVDDALLEPLVEAAAPFALDARRRLLSRGAVSFDALLSLARDLLRDHPEVREKERGRFRMLLVDEFQDTDPMQYEIVLYLSGRPGERETDAHRVPLEPGRLFLVGDPKQSIYRFRGADYEAFRRAIERVASEGGLELDLVANFRSVPAVVGPLNDLFLPTWRASRWQPEYVPIAPARADAPPLPRVEVWTVPGKLSGERRDREGALVAERARQLVEQEGFAWRDLFVLLRAFTSVNHYVRPLRDAGIPFLVDGGRLFLERPEVRHLMAVLRALARPSDPVALLAYLRSPAGAVPDSDLAAHASFGGRFAPGEEVDAGRLPLLARALARLRALREETEDLPADAVVRRAMARTRLLTLGAFAHEGAQRVANLGKIAALAAELARDGRLALNDVLDEIESERGSDVEGDSPLADERVDAVRILTVHKAKGLENRVVFVPDLARRTRTGGGAGGGLAIAGLPGGGKALAIEVGGARNAASLLHEIEEKRHEEAEGLRLLYVAATRARERLILLAGSQVEAPWSVALRSWGYSAKEPPADGAAMLEGRVVHRIAPEIVPPTRRQEKIVSEPLAAIEAYGRAVARYGAAARPPLARPSGPGERRDDRVEAGDRPGVEPGAPGRDVARAAGIAVHDVLDRWDPREGDPPEALVREAVRRASNEAAAGAAAVGREAAMILAALVRSPLLSRLRSVEVLGREIPVLLRKEDGTAESGVLDLLFRESDGSLVVVDYKTDRDLEPEEAVSRYGEQVRVYARAVERALGLGRTPRAELWLLRRGIAIDS